MLPGWVLEILDTGYSMLDADLFRYRRAFSPFGKLFLCQDPNDYSGGHMSFSVSTSRSILNAALTVGIPP